MDERAKQLASAKERFREGLKGLVDDDLKMDAMWAAAAMMRLRDRASDKERPCWQRMAMRCVIYGICAQALDAVGCIGWVGDDGKEVRNEP